MIETAPTANPLAKRVAALDPQSALKHLREVPAAEVATLLADMPPAVRELLPAMRSRAAEDLRDLRRVES